MTNELSDVKEQIEACVGVLAMVRRLTTKAGVDFNEFMSDKWDLFNDPDTFIAVQMFSYKEAFEFLCRDSTSMESTKMQQYVASL